MESTIRVPTRSYTVLLDEVKETFGSHISTSRDCNQLSEEIYFKTSFRINPNTLRRCFGLVKAEYPPSGSTLNILSKYCGYDSYDDLLANKKQKPAITDQNTKGIQEYLVSLFKSTTVREVNDETFLGLVKQTIHFLHK